MVECLFVVAFQYYAHPNHGHAMQRRYHLDWSHERGQLTAKVGAP